MAMRHFSAVFERVSDGFSAFLPDLTSAGDTIDRAAAQAEVASALHLRGLVEKGGAIAERRGMNRSAFLAGATFTSIREGRTA